MEKECISNSLIITTVKGKGSLKVSRVQLPQPRSNEAIVHNSHIAQNTIDGVAFLLLLLSHLTLSTIFQGVSSYMKRRSVLTSVD